MYACCAFVVDIIRYNHLDFNRLNDVERGEICVGNIQHLMFESANTIFISVKRLLSMNRSNLLASETQLLITALRITELARREVCGISKAKNGSVAIIWNMSSLGPLYKNHF